MSKIDPRKRELLEGVLKRARQTYQKSLQGYKKYKVDSSLAGTQTAFLYEIQANTAGLILGYSPIKIESDLGKDMSWLVTWTD